MENQRCVVYRRLSKHQYSFEVCSRYPRHSYTSNPGLNAGDWFSTKLYKGSELSLVAGSALQV